MMKTVYVTWTDGFVKRFIDMADLFVGIDAYTITFNDDDTVIIPINGVRFVAYTNSPLT